MVLGLAHCSVTTVRGSPLLVSPLSGDNLLYLVDTDGQTHGGFVVVLLSFFMGQFSLASTQKSL